VIDVGLIDPDLMRVLFNLQGPEYTRVGGGFEIDPYPVFHRLRESGPVHPSTPGELIGFHGEAHFEGLPFPDRPHFSAFDFATCDAVVRDPETYSSSPHPPGSDEWAREVFMIQMDAGRHRRYRALVQPSFVPKRAHWWIDNWVAELVDALITRIQPNGRADLNIELFASIPMLTICASFGVGVADALAIRSTIVNAANSLDDTQAIATQAEFVRIVAPLVAARRTEPGDDLISVLVQAELTDDEGTHRLTDEEVLGFAFLLLAAGSGTTWKQMGITMLALLSHPRWLDRVRDEPSLLRNVIEESLRWMPTDPAFARFVTRDVVLGGVEMPAGSIIHVTFAAANRDPARWDRPDEFDPGRPSLPHLGFGGGPHVCLGMHVARAEMTTAISAVLERLPNIRLDPDAAPPRITGVYERGPTAVPVVWD